MTEYSNNPLRVFWSSAVLAMRALFSWLNPAMWLTQLLFMSLFQIAFFVYVATFVNNSEVTVEYVAIGNALQSLAIVSVFAVCNITGEEKNQGTIENLLVSPANRFSVFVGRAMFQVVNGLATVVIAFFYAAVIFNVDFSNANMLGLGLVILITTFAMTGFGLMLSSLGLFLRTSMIIANIFLFIGLLVCGVNFPVSYLPWFLQPLSYAIPMTYGTDAARMAVAGASLGDMSELLMQEMLVGVVVVIVGYAMFRLFERLARSKGTLDRF
jgi:ABC-2 type transport system permease protein